jgi:quercetin dioxygenase-like cupin family protein
MGSTAKAEPLVVRAGATRSRTYEYLGPGVSGSCLIDAKQTGGVFSVFEIDTKPGAFVPPHTHTSEAETLYILEGCFEIQRGDQLIEMAAGMALHSPRRVVHGFRCVGNQAGRGLLITTPGGIENFFGELSAAAGESPVPGDIPFDRLEALMLKYGICSGARPADLTEYGYLAPSRFVGMGNHRGHILASADDTSGALILTNYEVDPHGGPHPHLHSREDEAFYILEGHFDIMLGDQMTEAGPGDFIFAPRGAAHWWSNCGDVPAYALVLIAPAHNFEEFTLRMEKLVARISEDTSPDNPDTTVRDEIRSLYQRHFIELVDLTEPSAVIK